MSAIGVIYNLDGRPAQRAEADSMMNTLSHRGGDGQGLWLDGALGMGHLMKWTTLESLQEHLPLFDRESSLAITCDARIDNRDELIAQLKLRGRPTDDIADSELILKSYKKWGEDCVQRFIGDFVFAIWDSRARKLFCARDPLGIKHFYYVHEPGKLFALASEIKALLVIDRVSHTLDEEYLADYLVVNTENKVSTFYKDISRLPATYALTINDTGLKVWKYWRPESEEIRLRNDNEYHEAFLEKFTQAVSCRLRSAFPIGSTLSGGLDSSAVVCVASKLLSDAKREPIHSFSGIFPTTAKSDPRIDEMKYMRLAIERAGCISHFVNADNVSPVKDLDRIIDYTDQPMGHLNVFMAFEIYKAAQKEDVRVLLTGHDGDCTVSYGYEDLELFVRRGRFLRLFKEASALKKNIPHPKHSMKYLAWHRGIKPAIPESVVALWRTIRGRRIVKDDTPIFYPVHFEAVNEEFRNRIGIKERIRRFENSSFPDDASRAESHWAVLTNGTFASMHEQSEKLAAAHGIEQRHPFFDRRLIEFCGRLPPGHRLYKGWTRSIFRHAMEGILPREIQWRKDKARLGAHVKINLFKYESRELKKISEKTAERLRRYIDLDRLRDIYRSCRTNSKRRDSEVLFILTSVYLLSWLERYEASNKLRA